MKTQQVPSASTRRPWLIIISAIVVLVISTTAIAQQASKIYRVGMIDNEPSVDAPRLAAFRQELRKLGWVEGQNLVIEARIGPEAQFPSFAAQLVQLGVDLIFAPKSSATQASQRETRSIPIVIAVAGDPVAS